MGDEYKPNESWRRDRLSRFIGFLNGAGFVIQRDGETPEQARELINRYLGTFDESEYEDAYYDEGYTKGVTHKNREAEEQERHRILYGR